MKKPEFKAPDFIRTFAPYYAMLKPVKWHFVGALARLADVLIAIPCGFTPHVQEAGMAVYHCLCEQIEQYLFG